MLINASPPLKTQRSRWMNDWISTKTTTAASLLCHPTVSASAATSSTTHPISRA